MIFALLANGASAVPLFVPLLPQALLIYLTFPSGGWRDLRGTPSSAVIIALIFIVLATIAGLSSDADNLSRLYKLLGNSLVAVVVARALINRYGRGFPSAYAHAVMGMSLLGVLGLVLASLTEWHVTANIGERAYHTNLLTVWISDSGFDSSQAVFSPFKYRLQSFFDEPGTYGMLLVPALFHFLDKGSYSKAAIMTACVFLSESASAWMFAAVLLSLKLYFAPRRTDKVLVLAFLVLIGIVIYPDVIKLYEIKVGLDEAYANSSSFGTRSMEYDYVLRNLATHFVPFTRIDGAYAELEGISSSYVSWYVLAGGLFLLILAWVLLALSRLALHTIKRNDELHRFALVMAVILFSSGFQRTSFLDNILFMSLFYWSISQARPMKAQVLSHDHR